MPPCLGVRAPLAGACVSKKRTATRSLSFWVRPMASFSSLNWPSYLVCVCVAFLPLSVLLSTSFNATASHLSLPLDELFLYQNISFLNRWQIIFRLALTASKTFLRFSLVAFAAREGRVFGLRLYVVI